MSNIKSLAEELILLTNKSNTLDEAIRQLEEEHKVFHTIVVTLIYQAKLNQLSLEEVKGNLNMLVKFVNK